ncbi:MAG: hypothetical protein MZV63_26735 [Marinilabiliales bacterium]|nr:hypothetical protein [Marinilabiliales bacterium]
MPANIYDLGLVYEIQIEESRDARSFNDTYCAG